MNGKKRNGKQNYYCKDCRKQFLSPDAYQQAGRRKDVLRRAGRAFVNGVSIRGMRSIFGLSYHAIYKILLGFRYDHRPKRKFYDRLEVDEFWTFVGRKKNKKWLIYAYHRASGEIVAYAWGKRDEGTAVRLRNRLKSYGVSYGAVATDNWSVFCRAFEDDVHLRGKWYTKGIEGNNCRLRHLNRRFFRKTCCFSKKLLCHLKAFKALVYFINSGLFLCPAYLL